MQMLSSVSDPIVGILALLGALFSVISAFGIIRLPDVYLRSHAATKSATLGIMCVLLAAFLFFFVADEGNASARILLGIVFVFITAPIGGHLMGRAAYRSGVPLWERSVQDDLKQVIHPGAPAASTASEESGGKA